MVNILLVLALSMVANGKDIMFVSTLIYKIYMCLSTLFNKYFTTPYLPLSYL